MCFPSSSPSRFALFTRSAKPRKVAAEVGKVMDRMLRRLEAAERQGQVEVQQVRRTAGWRQAGVNLPEQGGWLPQACAAR